MTTRGCGTGGSPLFGDLGDPESAEGVGAGGKSDDGGADAVRGLAEQSGAVARILADGVTERGDTALRGLQRERNGEAGVVAQAGRDRVAGRLLRRQDGETQDGSAFADQLANERNAAAREAFKGAVALVLS